MKILYKKPKLGVVITEIEDISVNNVITVIFKLDFLPCEEFIPMVLNFLIPPQDKEIGIWGEDYEIISSNISHILNVHSNQEYLSRLQFYFYASDKFEIKLKVKNSESNGLKYLGFNVSPNPLFFASPRTYFIPLPPSNMKKLSSLFTVPEHVFTEGDYYNSPSEFDIADTNLINYGQPYYTIVIPNGGPVPIVQFAVPEMSSSEELSSSGEIINLLREIVILRTGDDLSLNSIVRLDITAHSATLGEDYFAPGMSLYSYVQFNSGETEKRLLITTLVDDLVEGTESFTLKLTPENNAEIGLYSQMVYYIEDSTEV